MRLVKCHADVLECGRSRPELTASNRRDEAIEDEPGKHLGGGVATRKGRDLVKIPVIEISEQSSQRI